MYMYCIPLTLLALHLQAHKISRKLQQYDAEVCPQEEFL